MADIELPLTAHLEELRIRLGRALGAVAVGFCICYPNSQYLFEWLQAPLTAAAASSGIDATIIGTGVAEAFFTRLKVSFIAALFLTLPISLLQVWRFIEPGLHDNEARYARGFVFFGTIFFLGGAGFCYQIVFPLGFPFFLQEYESIGVDPVLRISEYLSFASRLLLAFGLTFEMTVATFFLARAGMVTHTMLIAYARYAVLILFVVAAILTPPDAASQLLMAGPLLALYGVSIGVAWAFGRGDRSQPPATSTDA